MPPIAPGGAWDRDEDAERPPPAPVGKPVGESDRLLHQCDPGLHIPGCDGAFRLECRSQGLQLANDLRLRTRGVDRIRPDTNQCGLQLDGIPGQSGLEAAMLDAREVDVAHETCDRPRVGVSGYT